MCARELAHPSPGVPEALHAGDAVVGEADEVDLVDAHCPSGRLEAPPRADSNTLNNDARHGSHGRPWARNGHLMGTNLRKRKPAAPVGPLTWCFLERMTRFELATLTLAR